MIIVIGSCVLAGAERRPRRPRTDRSAASELYDYVQTKNKLPYVTYTLVATYGRPIRGQMLLPASRKLCQYLYYVKYLEFNTDGGKS